MLVALLARGRVRAVAAQQTGARAGRRGRAASRPLPDAELAPLRAAAALPPCPAADRRAGRRAAGRGHRAVPRRTRPPSTSARRSPAGRRWSTCGRPGARRAAAELPALADYAARPGAVPVLGIDVRDDPRAALALLRELGVALPTVTDPDGALRAALDVPPALPRVATSCAPTAASPGSTRPSPFRSADEVAAAVERLLTASVWRLRRSRARHGCGRWSTASATSTPADAEPPPHPAAGATGGGPRCWCSSARTPRTVPTCCSSSGPARCATTPVRSRSPAAAPTRTTPTPWRTALREAEEETGVDPAGVVPLARAARAVHPAVGLRRDAGARALGATGARCTRWTRRDGRGRARAARPTSPIRPTGSRSVIRRVTSGPAFDVAGLLVWGFTGGLLSALLDLGGWARPVGHHRVGTWTRPGHAVRATGRRSRIVSAVTVP